VGAYRRVGTAGGRLRATRAVCDAAMSSRSLSVVSRPPSIASRKQRDAPWTLRIVERKRRDAPWTLQIVVRTRRDAPWTLRIVVRTRRDAPRPLRIVVRTRRDTPLYAPDRHS